MIKKLPKALVSKDYFEKFRQGDEAGLTYFYRLLYPIYAYRTERYVKDDVIADCITQEAFLRLWLLRNSIKDVQHLHEFLVKQTHDAGIAYYRKTDTRFHRSLLRLDGIEDFQEFMLGYEMEDDEAEDTLLIQQLELEKKKQWDKLQTLLPNLSQQQQLFIRLCLKYSFSYDRIAWHLGGISDYEVAQRVEKTISTLKSALCDSNKLDCITKRKTLTCEGGLSDEQAKILNMRYELQYSFEEIAEALNLNDSHVKKAFVQAYATIRKSKQSA